MSEQQTKQQTKQRVLECACQLFADKGFSDTTIQDICDEAHANIAAVNYYFSNKEALYCKAWEYAAKKTNELGGEIDITLPSREWLERTLEQRIRALFSDGPAGWLPKFIHNDHHERSHMSRGMKETVLKPIHALILTKLKELLGEDTSSIQLMSAAAFVLGTMPGLLHLRHHYLKERKLTDTEIDELIQQAKIYVFGGLDAMCDAQTTGAEQ